MKGLDCFDVDSVVHWPILSEAVSDEMLRQMKSEEGRNAVQQQLAKEIEEIKDTLTCTICCCLVIDPMDCPKCDLTVCGRCAAKMGKCPLKCKTQFKKGHRMVKLLLNRTIVSCPNKLKHEAKVNVCQAVLPVHQMMKHLEEDCPFRVAMCRGHHRNCTFSGFASRMFVHES